MPAAPAATFALLRRALRATAAMPYPAMQRKGRCVHGRARTRASFSPYNRHVPSTSFSPYLEPRANVRDVFELYRGERDARKVASVMAQWTEAVAALEQLTALPAALQAQLFDHDWHHKNDGRTPPPRATTPP